MNFIDKIPNDLLIKKEYLNNEIVLKKDNLCSSILYVKRGKIAKMKGNRVIEVYNQYQVVGLDIIFSSNPFYEYNYISLELTSINLISKEILLDPNLYINILEYFSLQFKNINEHNILLSLKSNKERVINYLYLEYKKRSSSSFVISMTKKELADFLNINSNELTNILSFLIENNIIANKNKLYTLIDLSFFSECLF